MKSPRRHRPRLLLLPLLVGVLLAPAFLTTSAMPSTDGDVQAGVICKNVVAPKRKLDVPRTAPTCVNCRAPLIDAPLARVPRVAPASLADPSPAA